MNALDINLQLNAQQKQLHALDVEKTSTAKQTVDFVTKTVNCATIRVTYRE